MAVPDVAARSSTFRVALRAEAPDGSGIMIDAEPVTLAGGGGTGKG